MFRSFNLFVFWLYTGCWLRMSQLNENDLEEKVMEAMVPRALKIQEYWGKVKKLRKQEDTMDERVRFATKAEIQMIRLFVAQRTATRLGALPPTNSNGGKWRWKNFLPTVKSSKGGVG